MYTEVTLLYGNAHQRPSLLSDQISDALCNSQILLNCPSHERPLLILGHLFTAEEDFCTTNDQIYSVKNRSHIS